MEKDLISVIVPVYNVENYLEKCLDSIVNQTYKNIEVILIDDGSTDKSGEICNRYKKMYSNIKVYHNNNLGAAGARNFGIKESKGKYICFVDSDDEIKKEYVEYLYGLILKYNTTISVSSYIINSGRKKYDIGEKYIEERLDTKESIRRLLLSKGFTVSLCAKMYEKKVFDNIKFPEGYMYEDDATIYKIFLKSDGIAYGNKSNYIYYVRTNSVMTKKFSKERMILLKYAEQMVKDINGKFPELNKEIEKKYIDYNFSIIRQMVDSNLDKEMNEIKMQLINKIKKYTKTIIFSNIYGIKEKMAIISILFGEKIYKKCWNLYKKIKY